GVVIGGERSGRVAPARAPCPRGGGGISGRPARSKLEDRPHRRLHRQTIVAVRSKVDEPMKSAASTSPSFRDRLASEPPEAGPGRVRHSGQHDCLSNGPCGLQPTAGPSRRRGAEGVPSRGPEADGPDLRTSGGRLPPRLGGPAPRRWDADPRAGRDEADRGFPWDLNGTNVCRNAKGAGSTEEKHSCFR